ncbi:MAG: AtpZ/AtpI family protein [Acidimicrobiales bacterium]
MEQQYDGVEPDLADPPAAGRLPPAAVIAAGGTVRGPQGELYNSFGQGFSRAFELAVTPALFGLMGYGLDRWVGTLPLFTAVFSIVALVAMLLRTWFGYCYRMEALEAAGPWASRPVPKAPDTA